MPIISPVARARTARRESLPTRMARNRRGSTAWRGRALGCAAFACLALPPLAAPAAESIVGAQYALTLAGLPLASFIVKGEFRENAYVLDGEMHSSKLVTIISSISGWSTTRGNISHGRLSPENFEVLIEWGKDRRNVKLAYNGKGVERADLTPPLDTAADRVPLTQEHRLGTIDPFTAIILFMPEGKDDGESACDRRLPVFDGRYRYDLILSYKRTETAGKQNEDRIFVCKVKYVPIAGHKEHREQTVFWRDREDIEIWLALAPKVGLLVPYRAVLPTPLGDAILSMRGLEIRDLRQAAGLTDR